MTIGPTGSADRILVWGAGAIGGTVAAYLRRAGLDVTVVDANEPHVQAIRERGLAITGPIRFSSRCRRLRRTRSQAHGTQSSYASKP